MSAAVAVPLIVGAASAGAQVYGARRAANASRDAARMQERAGDRALDFSRQAYQDQRAATSPYVQIGAQALARLGQMTGQSMPSLAAAGDASGSPMRPSPRLPSLAAPQLPAADETVTLQGDDGSIRRMPRSMAQPFLARGARVIG